MTTTFGTLGVPAPLVAALAADGKTDPFPIQTDTLPDSLAGRDVLGRGKTGSGKTLAFALPMVARLGTRLAGGPRRAGRPLGLVLAPTRELATQIAAVIAPLAEVYGLRTTTIFGGISQNRQVAALTAGVDIVVACPGRLEDLMGQRFVHLDAVEITVLDEADHMADLGFLPGVTRILSATPAGGQRMLFSATLDNGVDKLVRRFLSDPATHSVDDANSPVAAMTHHVYGVDGPAAKTELVHTLASGRGRRILFLRTKHHAKKLAVQLNQAGIPAVDLHGNLSQPQRDRNLAAFADGDVRVLVATDVAARGVHVDDVELVVHVDPPVEHKAYLHRSGRTARAGSSGDVVTVVLPAQERDVQQLLRKAAIGAQLQRVTAGTPVVATLVGEVAERVAPIARAVPAGGGGTSQGANARRKREARSENSGDRPRRDRSGRPAAQGGSAGQSRAGSRRAGSPAARSTQGRSDAPTRSGSVTAWSSSSGRPAAASAAPRPARKNRRVSRPAG
jgi:superfamily II DNA/RNA helicase